MNELDILYNHYTDTCNNTKKDEEQRNRLFIIICALMGILFLFSADSNSLMEMLKKWLQEQYSIDFYFSSAVIQITIWLLFLFSLSRYCSINISIDKTYKYIDLLEKKINEKCGENIISLEGDFYLTKYPLTQNYMYYLYRTIVPIFLVIGITIMLWSDFHSVSSTLQKIIEVLCEGLVIVYWYENCVRIKTEIIKSKKTKKKGTNRNNSIKSK